jgi:uncharacterized short protein YbdD (DUF466 family)
MSAALRRALDFLRALSGDDAYERHLAHRRAAHPGEPLPSRKAFYAERERRKWEGISRCC